jgi:hypothetical protein
VAALDGVDAPSCLFHKRDPSGVANRAKKFEDVGKGDWGRSNHAEPVTDPAEYRRREVDQLIKLSAFPPENGIALVLQGCDAAQHGGLSTTRCIAQRISRLSGFATETRERLRLVAPEYGSLVVR